MVLISYCLLITVTLGMLYTVSIRAVMVPISYGLLISVTLGYILSQ